MPHTLRAVSTSDEDAAALSMLTGFDLDPARQANQTEGRIRGQSFTQTPPSPRDRGGALAGRTTPSRRPVAARHRPSRPETSGQDKDRRQAQEARGSAAHHLGRPGPSHQKIGILHQGRARLPRRQQKTQARHARLRLRLPALRPRLPGLLPAQTRPRQTPWARPSSPWRTAASRPFTPRSATAPSTPHNQPRNYPPPLDTPHRDTPGPQHDHRVLASSLGPCGRSRR